LFSRKDVDRVNENNLNNLKGRFIEFNAVDTADNENYLKQLANACPVRKKLILKVGAQVMFMKTINPTQGLVNGARGVITRFVKFVN
jgi:ATP-dependent DNA helicase PIF1